MQNTDLGIDSALTDTLCISLNILMIARSKTITNKKHQHWLSVGNIRYIVWKQFIKFIFLLCFDLITGNNLIHHSV